MNNVLILEDDAVGKLDIDISKFNTDGITYLGGYICKKGKLTKSKKCNYEFNFKHGINIVDNDNFMITMTMSYYIPTYTLLKQLYDKIVNSKRYRAIDIMICNTDIKKYFVYPAIFTEEKVESTIRGKKKYSNKLYEIEK